MPTDDPRDTTEGATDDARCPRCGSRTNVFDLAAASSITCPRCDPAHAAYRERRAAGQERRLPGMPGDR